MLCTRYTTVMKQLAEYASCSLDSSKLEEAKAVLKSYYRLGPENFDIMARLNAGRLEYKIASLLPGPALPVELAREPFVQPGLF